jgi:hypothetical protein
MCITQQTGGESMVQVFIFPMNSVARPAMAGVLRSSLRLYTLPTLLLPSQRSTQYMWRLSLTFLPNPTALIDVQETNAIFHQSDLRVNQIVVDVLGAHLFQKVGSIVVQGSIND